MRCRIQKAVQEVLVDLNGVQRAQVLRQLLVNHLQDGARVPPGQPLLAVLQEAHHARVQLRVPRVQSQRPLQRLKKVRARLEQSFLGEEGYAGSSLVRWFRAAARTRDRITLWRIPNERC